MTYLRVKEETADKLHLARTPSLRAWLILGFISFALGVALGGEEYLLWKITIISGAVFVGLNIMEDWEDCIFDKITGLVTVSRVSLIQKVFQLTWGSRVTTAYLHDITRVDVDHEAEGISGCAPGAPGQINGCTVVLYFASGLSFGVTETATFGDISEHKQIAEKIYDFLELDMKTPIINESNPLEEESTDSSLDDSSDDFERISAADLPDMAEVGEIGEAQDKKDD